MTPEWIQAVTSVLTFLAAVAAGWYARRAAIHTKQQAEASDKQVEIAGQALEITRKQAAAAEEHSLESLEIARQEAQAVQAAAARQVEEAKATYRRYEESKLDAVIPEVLATVRRPGWFIETKELYEPGRWTDHWEPFTGVQHFEESQRNEIRFRIRLNVVIENVSSKTARVDIVDLANGELVNIRSDEHLIVPPHQERVFTWTRSFTPGMLATEDEINDSKNWLFNLTLWVRDLGMNVRDTYRFNSDLRLFSRDGTRLVVRPEPEHNWTENVAPPLQNRVYERLETNRSITVNLS
ncbi:hypothetical protein [Arthrobacter sp. 4R501]|uniref:hypothetical protein n=1 Tax=Arthrobacter sp. 4R501 TaxID=2058886 RepID=UPI000CE46315|nr:hypothetical protein [Arthrobacter sp. 4R501]